MLPPRVLLAVCLSAIVLGLSIGCGDKPVPVTDRSKAQLAGLARLYGEYAARNQGKTPGDEATFREFLAGLPEGQRRAMGFDDPAALNSPRDGKPYAIVCGKHTLATLPKPGLNGQPVVIYEREGKDGKRLVGNAQGAVAELTAEELRRAVGQP